MITFERDTEPYNKSLDNQLMDYAKTQQVNAQGFWGHTLYDPDYLLELNGGKTPLSMNDFLNILSIAGNPSEPLGVPRQLPPPPSNVTSKPIKVFRGVPTLLD